MLEQLGEEGGAERDLGTVMANIKVGRFMAASKVLGEETIAGSAAQGKQEQR